MQGVNVKIVRSSALQVQQASPEWLTRLMKVKQRYGIGKKRYKTNVIDLAIIQQLM
jgi:hypothetical protein